MPLTDEKIQEFLMDSNQMASKGLRSRDEIMNHIILKFGFSSACIGYWTIIG
jgi:hypothetical protein